MDGGLIPSEEVFYSPHSRQHTQKATTLTESKCSPAVPAAGRHVFKVFLAPGGNMPEETGKSKAWLIPKQPGKSFSVLNFCGYFLGYHKNYTDIYYIESIYYLI